MKPVFDPKHNRDIAKILESVDNPKLVTIYEALPENSRIRTSILFQHNLVDLVLNTSTGLHSVVCTEKGKTFYQEYNAFQNTY